LQLHIGRIEHAGVPAGKEKAAAGMADNFIQGFAYGQLMQVNGFTALQAAAGKTIPFVVGAIASYDHEKKQGGGAKK
jgi:hypothetical protein